MSIIESLITDRTAQDVQELREMLASGNLDQAQHKGAYNYTDLNRVAEALKFVAQELEAIGFDCSIAKNYKVFTMADIPTLDDTTQILEDLAKLKNQFSQVPLPNILSNFNYMSFEEANNIEQLLVDLHNLVPRIQKAWSYSSDIYAGEL